MIAMKIDRSTLNRWLEELNDADRYLAQTHEPEPLRLDQVQRHLWFVIGQIKSLLTEDA